MSIGANLTGSVLYPLEDATGSAALVNMLIGLIGTLQDVNFPPFLHVCCVSED